MRQLFVAILILASLFTQAQTKPTEQKKDSVITPTSFALVLTQKDLADLHDFIMASDNFSDKGKQQFFEAFFFSKLHPLKDSVQSNAKKK